MDAAGYKWYMQAFTIFLFDCEALKDSFSTGIWIDICMYMILNNHN